MKKIFMFSILLFIVSIRAGFSQVAISTSGSNADPSAMLDINATDKGLLIPRVSLNGIANTGDPIINPATGLLVYNMEGNDLPTGIYMWTGMNWSSLATTEQVHNALPAPSGSGIFGEIYEYHPMGSFSSIAIPSNGTFASWTTGTQGDIAGMSYNASALIAENSGMYSVSFSSVLLVPGGKTIEAALFVNGIRQDDLHSRAFLKEGSKSHDISFSGLIALFADDVVSVGYTMDDNGTVKVEIANLSLTKID